MTKQSVIVSYKVQTDLCLTYLTTDCYVGRCTDLGAGIRMYLRTRKPHRIWTTRYSQASLYILNRNMSHCFCKLKIYNCFLLLFRVFLVLLYFVLLYSSCTIEHQTLAQSFSTFERYIIFKFYIMEGLIMIVDPLKICFCFSCSDYFEDIKPMN